MAHSVWTTDAELERLADARTSVAHCPCSNAALGSGRFAIGRHVRAGVSVSLGTDVGGGTGFGMPKEMLQAYLTQQSAPDGTALDPARPFISRLGRSRGARSRGRNWRFERGEGRRLRHLKPPPHSPLQKLAVGREYRAGAGGIVTMSGAESVDEVRVEGDV
jgi:guanine deaminase